MGIEEVGRNIRNIRLKLGLSQKELGEKVGKSESQIGAYETAKTGIYLDTLFKIAEVANVPPQELIAGPEPKKEDGVWDAELRIYNKEDRLAVIGILANNGYDVGQHKRQATPTGKTVDYFVHATDRKENANTSK